MISLLISRKKQWIGLAKTVGYTSTNQRTRFFTSGVNQSHGHLAALRSVSAVTPLQKTLDGVADHLLDEIQSRILLVLLDALSVSLSGSDIRLILEISGTTFAKEKKILVKYGLLEQLQTGNTNRVKSSPHSPVTLTSKGILVAKILSCISESLPSIAKRIEESPDQMKEQMVANRIAYLISRAPTNYLG